MAHHCEIRTPYEQYGPAITECFEDKDGTLWVDNGEYATQVNFCPMCGKEAKVRYEEKRRDS